MPMRKGDGVIVLALSLIALAVAWAVAQEPPRSPLPPPGGVPLPDTSIIMGPVSHVGPTGFTGGLTEDGKGLCRDAPLNSFGPLCEGYTWSKVNGTPTEWRTRRGGAPDFAKGQFFGFM